MICVSKKKGRQRRVIRKEKDMIRKIKKGKYKNDKFPRARD